jgi:hypothetical protein
VFAFNLLGQLADRGRTYGAHLNVDFSAAQSGDDAVLSLRDRAQGMIISDHREYDVRRFGNHPRTFSPLHADFDQWLRLVSGAIISSHRMTGGKKAPRHPATHYT